MKITRKSLFFVAVLALLTGPTQAAELHVPADHNTIQAAIDAAVDGDIVIVADGTYTGEGNRGIGFRRKAITVRSENGPENCIIDCETSARAFYFGSRQDSDSVLDGFTITRSSGHAISCSYASPTITNCIITGNYTGGIYCNLSDPTITNCRFTSNSGRYGGGISCYQSNPTIVNCTITDNTSTYRGGGGIYCRAESNLTIINCTFSGNSSTDDRYGGGGIFCDWGSSLTVVDCTFSGNSAISSGGAISNEGSGAQLIGCLFSGNSAGENGGAIYSTGECRLTGCTFSDNSAQDSAGGIFSEANKPIFLTNCILWGNTDTSGGELAQIQGGTPEVIFSCIQDDDQHDTYIPFNDDPNNQNIDDDPMFVRNPDHGGDGWGDDPETPDVNEAANDDFGDLHLMRDSPCINAGLPNFVAGPNAVDVDGQPRIAGLRVDMGAYEHEKIIVATRPVAGDIWTAGSVHQVEWTSYGAGAVDILLSTDGGGNWQSIENTVPDTGSYTCQFAGAVRSEQAVVSVVPSVADANVTVIDSGVFAIRPYHSPRGVATGPRRRHKKQGPAFGCVKWTFETEGPVTAAVTLGPKIRGMTRAYIACEDGKVYTLDAEDGALLWSYDTNSPLLASAAVSHFGTVYVAATDGRLYAIGKRGRLLWTHTTDEPIFSSPVVSHGQIYVCSEDASLYALAQDGSDLWRFETGGFGALGGSIFATPQIGTDGAVYLAGLYDPNLYALNPDDGSIKWVCNFEFAIDPCDPNSATKGGWPFAAPAIAEDGTIYQTLLYDSHLYAIEPETGTIIWAKNLADPCSGLFDANDAAVLRYADGWSSPALAPDGTIYVSLDDPYLRAVHPNGTIKWAAKLGTMGAFTLTLGDDGLVYAASDDHYLYVVDHDGEQVAQFQGDHWLSHPVIAPDRTIIVSDANNTVWAISQETCDGQTPVLDGSAETETSEPIQSKGRKKHK